MDDDFTEFVLNNIQRELYVAQRNKPKLGVLTVITANDAVKELP